MSPDSSIVSGVDDEIGALAQPDSSKPPRRRRRASRDRNIPKSSSAQADEHASAPNSGGADGTRGSKNQDSDEDDTLRQLSEFQQKYSKLEKRFHDLHELAVKKAEQNFELLKTQTDKNTRGEAHSDSPAQAQLITC